MQLHGVCSGRGRLKGADAEDHVASGRILHNSAAAKRVERGRDAFAARSRHLRNFFLGEIDRSLHQRAGTLPDLGRQADQHLDQPLYGVVERHAVHLRVRLFERGRTRPPIRQPIPAVAARIA